MKFRRDDGTSNGALPAYIITTIICVGVPLIFIGFNSFIGGFLAIIGVLLIIAFIVEDRKEIKEVEAVQAYYE